MIALYSIQALYPYTLPLSRMLQSPSIDLVEAVEMADGVINKFKKIRNDVDHYLGQIYDSALKLLKDVISENYKIHLPRIASRQNFRVNIETET